MLTSRWQRGIFLLNAAGSFKDVLGLSGQCCSLFSPFRKCYTHLKDLFLWYENPGKSGCVTLNWAWWDTFVDKRVGQSRSLPCAINYFHFEYTNTHYKSVQHNSVRFIHSKQCENWKYNEEHFPGVSWLVKVSICQLESMLVAGVNGMVCLVHV